MIRVTSFGRASIALTRALLRVVLIAGFGLTLLVGAASGAVAQDAVNDWVEVTGVDQLPGPGLYTDYSGGALNPDGTLLTVDNGEDDIIEYTPNGNGGWDVGRIIDLDQSELSDPVDDLEDITRMGGNRYAIIDENDNTLTVFDLPDGSTEVDEVYTVALWPFVDNFGGNGIEGLFYSFEDSVGNTDTFYVASEVNALIVRLDIVDGTVTNRGDDISLNIPAASAIYRVPNDGTFYVVANRTRSVYRFDSYGTLLGPPRQLAFGNPEGLTVSDDGSRILIIGEARGGRNEIQEFRPPSQRGETTLVQLRDSRADGIQRGDGSVDLNSDQLFIGPGPFNESALHFESLCIPADAEIRRASLSFVPAASEGSQAGLRVVGHRSASSPGLAWVQNNITNRLATVTVVSEGSTGAWSGSRPWREFAPDVTPILNEIRTLPGRGECGPVTLRVSTDGARRTARSVDGGAWAAPSLVIDWVRTGATSAVSVVATPTCVANAAAGTAGRVDAVVTNTSNRTQSIRVDFTGRASQNLVVAAGSEAALSWSGLRDGRYLTASFVAGAPTSSNAASVDCGAELTFTQRCIRPGNGVVDFTVLNVGEQPAELGVAVSNRGPEPLYLHGWQYGSQTVSGIRDGQYAAVVSRGEAVVSSRPVTVACGALPPPCSYQFTNNASFPVRGYVDLDGEVSALDLVQPGETRTLLMPEGFDRNLGDVFALFDEAFNYLEWTSTDAANVPAPCEWRVAYPFAEPVPDLDPVAVTLTCAAQSGRVQLTVLNQTRGFAVFRATIGDNMRQVAMSAGSSVDLAFDGLIDGPIEVAVVQVAGDESTVVFSELLVVDCGFTEPNPDPDRRPTVRLGSDAVVHATSCLAGNGRHDITWVNDQASDATYVIDFQGLTSRAVFVSAANWGRLPFTGRADGTYQVTVRRDGVLISDRDITVRCDGAEPQLEDPEIQVVSACRAGLGYILFQVANDRSEATGYIIEFEGVRNRSTTAAPHGAAVRAVTGRPSGTYAVVVRAGNERLASFTVDVSCL